MLSASWPAATVSYLWYQLEVHQYCSGRLSAPNNWPITDCLVQDASSFNKSHVLTIVKSQWYDGPAHSCISDLTEILKSDSAWLGLFLSLDSWLPKNIFPSTKRNNRPIIGQCWLSNGRYRLLANWPIIGQYQFSADNRCTSSTS